MVAEEWGTKRLCPTSGKRFYDLNKNPIVSPYTGEVLEVDPSKSRMIAADAEDAVTAKAKAAEVEDEEVVLDDDSGDLSDCMQWGNMQSVVTSRSLDGHSDSQ